jgi:hypothetical protein
MFLHPVGSSGDIVHSGASGVQNADAPFFKLESARCGFQKKCVRSRYAILVFSLLVGSSSHVVHSSALGHEMSMHYFSCSDGPGAVSIEILSGHVTLNLCFCIEWDLQFTKCILVGPGHKMSTHYFSCSGGPVAVFI